MVMLSVVVPSYNEKGNVLPLIQRLDTLFSAHEIEYEIIWIDDNSTDGTDTAVKNLSSIYPVRFFTKQGQKGKAFSLLEGFSYAKGAAIAMIDADLQYPPEKIIAMYNQLQTADIIVANRHEKIQSFTRKFLSRGFMLIFGKFLHHLDVDVQSGLKVFKKQVIERINLSPTPWTFDLEFLVKARNAGFTISSIEIDFYDRSYGASKVKLVNTVLEIGLSAVKLKLNQSEVFPILYDRRTLHAGFYQNSIKYQPYNKLNLDESAFFRLTPNQVIILLGSLIALGLSFFFNWHGTLVFFVMTLTVLYFADIFF